MKPDTSQVTHIVHTVWATQLGLEVTPSDVDSVAPRSETLTAAIHISGDFRGSVLLECSRTLVRRAAAIMFGLPEDRLTSDDERDVIGELTNVVAGNIKALFPGENALSLPTIVEGTDYRVSSTDVKTLDEHFFSENGEPLTITVVEHNEHNVS